MISDTRTPALYIPHGGGPCFFMDWTMGPADTWHPMAGWLRSIPDLAGANLAAILVITAHWEQEPVAVSTSATHELLFDYYGFPPHTYELTWPAPGSPSLANKVIEALGAAGIEATGDHTRGLDHGVFVPMKVAFPDADIPVVAMSLRHGLDPADHLSIGRALAPLRDEGVLIVGSGMSYHNMESFMTNGALAASNTFGDWLDQAVRSPAEQRERMLADWAAAPSARACHPREEHLLPLMVVAGAAGTDEGSIEFEGVVMGAKVSAYGFGVR